MIKIYNRTTQAIELLGLQRSLVLEPSLVDGDDGPELDITADMDARFILSDAGAQATELVNDGSIRFDFA